MVGLAIGGLMSGGVDRGGRRGEGVEQERILGQARVPFAALGVQDPERRPTAGWSVAVVRDERLGALADDVATQADPRPAGQLEADAGRLVDRGREAAGRRPAKPWRIEDQEQGLCAPGQRGQSMEAIGDPGGLVGLGEASAGQVQDEHVDRTTGQERARDTQPLVQTSRRDDHEPFEPETAGDGLHWVEAARQVQPGHDGSGHLGFRGGAQRQGGPAAGAVAADRDAGPTREATRTQDGIERGEPGVDDPVIGERRDRGAGVGGLVHLHRRGCQGQGPDDPRSCGTPAGLEARQRGIHITTRGRHRTPNTRTNVLIRQDRICRYDPYRTPVGGPRKHRSGSTPAPQAT